MAALIPINTAETSSGYSCGGQVAQIQRTSMISDNLAGEAAHYKVRTYPIITRDGGGTGLAVYRIQAYSNFAVDSISFTSQVQVLLDAHAQIMHECIYLNRGPGSLSSYLAYKLHGVDFVSSTSRPVPDGRNLSSVIHHQASHEPSRQNGRPLLREGPFHRCPQLARRPHTTRRRSLRSL